MSKVYEGVGICLLAVIALASVGLSWTVAFATVTLVACAAVVAEYIKPDSRLVGYIKTYSKVLLAVGAGMFVFIIVNSICQMSPARLLGFMQRHDTLGGAINSSVLKPYALAELIMAVGSGLLGWALVYTKATRPRFWIGFVTVIVMMAAVVSVQFPFAPAYLYAKEPVTLDKQINVVYQDVKGKPVNVLVQYNGSGANDTAVLVAINEALSPGQKIQLLGDVRVIHGVKLQGVRIPGPDGKFIAGRDFLVDADDLVLKEDVERKSRGLVSKASSFAGNAYGTAADAASKARTPKRQPTTATINFADHQAGEEIDTGLQVKKGDAVRYTGVKFPFKSGGGYDIVGDTSCHAMADGVVRVTGTKGTITIEVTPM